MSCTVNFQALPSGVFETVFTPENVRGRTSMNSFTPLSFPKSRSALWDGSPAGKKLRLHLCTHRRPRLVLLEKALRLAQRHARHSNKPHLPCFLLGSVSVNTDEEGVTVTLDRFDPGRDQAGASCRFPSALLPGDVLVPCLFSTETVSDAVVQSEAELHQCFKELQQSVSSRQTLDLSQLLKVRVQVVCDQQSDASAFGLSWSAVCPSVSVDVDSVRAVPIIPTALLRSLTSVNRPSPHAANQQKGFLTMDQTRKLLLLLESDPKASNLPLVGLWLSGVTHVYNPQVWAWCLRFLYSSTLQDKVLSESRCFLLVLFGSTHRGPQFFQCRGPGPGLQLDYQLLTSSQCVTLYQQVVSVEGRTLQCELGSEDHSRQTELFREARTSFNRAAAGLSASDQDSGVEDEDLSPRPSPSPHTPAHQNQRVQPSVPELSLLIDSSFSSNHDTRQDLGPTHRPPPPADRKSAPPTRPAAPPHIHSTPNSNLQQPCTCCSIRTCTSIFSSPGLHPPAPPPSSHHHTPSHFTNHSPHTTSAPCGDSSSPAAPPPRFSHLTCVNQCYDQLGGVVPSDTYQLLLHQDRQLRLLQAQVQMLLEAQGKLQSTSQTPRNTASIAVETGASLFWGDPQSSPLRHQEVQVPPASACRPPSAGNLSVIWPMGGAENSDITGQEAGQHSVSGLQSPVLGESISMFRPADERQSFYQNLMSQLTSRLQDSDSKQEAEEESRRRTQSSLSRRRQSCGDPVVSATVSQLQQLGVDVDHEDLNEPDMRILQTVESSSTLASINPAAVLSRLSVAEPTASSLFPGGSVDLSLEANAIALRYLSDSQLSKLSLGGRAPHPSPTSCSNSSLLSPSNMSLATRKYMRRYGLIEEEEGGEDEKKAVDDQEVSACQPLTDALNVKLLPQSLLIRDLRPKMQLLTGDAKLNTSDKENSSSRRPSLERASSHHTEGSVGNILDLSRLRQLPKLF